MPFGRIPPSNQNPPGNVPPPAYSRYPNPAVEFRPGPRRPPAYDPGPPPPYSPPAVWQRQETPGNASGGSGSGSAGHLRESSV